MVSSPMAICQSKASISRMLKCRALFPSLFMRTVALGLCSCRSEAGRRTGMSINCMAGTIWSRKSGSSLRVRVTGVRPLFRRYSSSFGINPLSRVSDWSTFKRMPSYFFLAKSSEAGKGVDIELPASSSMMSMQKSSVSFSVTCSWIL